MNAIEKNRNKQLALHRQKRKRGVMAKNIRVTHIRELKTYHFDKQTERNTILANMYCSVLIEFLDEWNTSHKAKQFQNVFKQQLEKYIEVFIKENIASENIQLTHYKIMNIFIDELNEIETTDEMKLFCCVSHLFFIVIELAKQGLYISNKTLDMSLINFRKQLEINIDDVEYNRVMNILNNTKALSVVNL